MPNFHTVLLKDIYGSKGDFVKFLNLVNALMSPSKFAIAILWRCEDVIYKIKNREKKTKYGNENPDFKFYVIGFNCGWNGLAWIILHVIEHIEYAESKEYIPLVDLRNFRNQYTDASCKENIWEYWFEQPAEYDLKSIAESRNIIKSKKIVFPNDKNNIKYFDYKNEVRIQRLRYVYRKYIKINSETKQKILQLKQQIIGDKKVLGIMCRGTDFSVLTPPFHPIQPDPRLIVEEAEIIMKKYNCTHIFLSTEDKEIYDLFHKKFSDLILSVPQDRFSSKDINALNSLSALSDVESRKKIAFSYLASMHILSKCSCFTGGITGGSIVVKIMSDGFEYERFWDLGLYPDDESLSKTWRSFCEELFGRKVRN
jgi:hypothetical protein